jgi:hypothetical protein
MHTTSVGSREFVISFVPSNFAQVRFDTVRVPFYSTLTEFNTVVDMMATALKAGITAKPSRVSRAISLVLLALIVCGTTIEAAHRHVGIAAVSLANQTTSLSDSGTTQNSTLGRVNCSDCLICQLHQNFSSTLLSNRTVWSRTALREHYFEAATIAFHSRVDTPRRGRAPPFPS